ncbi:hypothetical protein CGCSCA4_v002077 [Colletotrichum siamense]|uniref:Uncharacterized protein n=1 Tax=Colletotrichum siamense TaxID=690259 RepID=A0A9P5F248_COLSI|nr:hypothetical protein CGCSCA4_v002077 [Colletotrichum siamense]KAF4864762.1 hypothetical protein CGCSCA2_v002212 [Colletotrichum siamense]
MASTTAMQGSAISQDPSARPAPSGLPADCAPTPLDNFMSYQESHGPALGENIVARTEKRQHPIQAVLDSIVQLLPNQTSETESVGNDLSTTSLPLCLEGVGAQFQNIPR